MGNKRKNKSVVFALCLVCIFGIMLLGINAIKYDTIKEDNSETVSMTNEDATNKTDDMGEVSDKSKIDREKYLTEISEADRLTNQEIHRGEYPNRVDSREVNPEFILDECLLSDYADGAEIEILAYEELPDINGDGMVIGNSDIYFNNGTLNADGTLNKVIQKVRVRFDSGVYGEEKVIENYEFIAVKLKMKITNIQNEQSDIYLGDMLRTEGLIYMDDGKLYRDTSVYNYDFPETTNAKMVYHSFMDYVHVEPNVVPDKVTLAPLEEVQGEVIYIVGKQDIDNIYIINSPNGGNIENFNAPHVQFLPFSLLKELPSK